MPDRKEIINAYRSHFPQLKDLGDNDVFRVVAVNDPELAQSWAKSQEHPVTPQMYPGRGPTGTEVMQDQAAEVLKGIPQAVTGIPGAAKAIGGAAWDALSGNYAGANQAGKQMLGGMAQPFTTSAQGLGALIAPQSVNAPSDESWKQAAQGAGAMLGSAELPNAIAGAGKALSPLAQALYDRIPSKALAGQKFQAINAQMGSTPASLTGVDAAASDALQLAGGKDIGGGRVIGTGSTAPKVLRDYIAQQNSGNPIDFETARQFQSKAGSLSAAEKMTTDAPMKAKISGLAKALAESNRSDAVAAGMGDVYDSAMRQYRQGAKLSSIKQAIATGLQKHAVEAAIGGAAAGTAYGIYKAATK